MSKGPVKFSLASKLRMIIICVIATEDPMTASGMQTAISALRQAGLFPTASRLAVTSLIFSGPTVALTPDEVCDRAADSGLALSQSEAAAILGELQEKGAVPRTLAPTRRTRTGLRRSVAVLQGMANPVRLSILAELAKGERSVGELRRLVGLQPSALSQHLARLRMAGLVATRRDATRIFYSLAGAEAKALLRGLSQAGVL